MATDNKLQLPFADGIYTFTLGEPQITELQQKCGVGIGGLFARVMKGRYEFEEEGSLALAHHSEFYLLDIVETVRQGLLGGNEAIVGGTTVKLAPPRVQQLLSTYVIGRPLIEGWDLAAAILAACVLGVGQPAGEKLVTTDAAPAAEQEA